MKILFTFPGGRPAPRHAGGAPRSRSDPHQARAVLGNEVATLDSADALQHTRAVQLCLLIAGVAWRASYSVRAWIRRWSAACPSARFRPR